MNGYVKRNFTRDIPAFLTWLEALGYQTLDPHAWERARIRNPAGSLLIVYYNAKGVEKWDQRLLDLLQQFRKETNK